MRFLLKLQELDRGKETRNVVQSVWQSSLIGDGVWVAQAAVSSVLLSPFHKLFFGAIATVFYIFSALRDPILLV